MLAAFGVFAGVGSGAAGLGHVVFPVVVELGEDVVFLGEIHLLAVVGTLAAFVVFGGAFGLLLVEADALHRKFFEGGIALEFLLDDGTEIEGGDLKDFEGMPELRRENQRLVLALAKILAETGTAHEDGRRLSRGRGALAAGRGSFMMVLRY